jgi:hypothetical protein
MRSASDTRSRVIGILLLWAIVFAASFVVPLFIPVTCQSFLCGFNRIEWWFWLQVAAFAVAIALAIITHISRAEISRRLKWACRAPSIFGGVEMSAVAVFIFWATY